ncbi:unnamed protein product [Periconia digitata]|uniref:Uncharacterized protein n=1 Tax=Periconia digitata TaxID=1303443 RepID=A0A9W4XKC7_9PLEO|nr:unnamed protein product [Periconia digitata]
MHRVRGLNKEINNQRFIPHHCHSSLANLSSHQPLSHDTGHLLRPIPSPQPVIFRIHRRTVRSQPLSAHLDPHPRRHRQKQITRKTSANQTLRVCSAGHYWPTAFDVTDQRGTRAAESDDACAMSAFPSSSGILD